MMVASTPPATPVVKIGKACHAALVSTMTVRFEGKTYRISSIELCGKKVVLRGKEIRVRTR